VYTCANFLHSRSRAAADEVVDVVRDGSRAALVLAGGGLVVSSSFPVPRPGDRVLVAASGVDAFWEVPEVALTRMAGESLFTEDGGGSPGYMVGVVESAGDGQVGIGGRTYRCDDARLLAAGAKISYDLGPDGELRVVQVLEQGVRQAAGATAVFHHKDGVYSGAAPGRLAGGDPRSRYGVMVSSDGDVFEVRLVARHGHHLGRLEGDLDSLRLKKRLAGLGAQPSREGDAWVWRIDMARPFAGSREEGWLGLVHLAGWIRDSEGRFPAIFGQLRDWVSGRLEAVVPKA
jgi:hypothetical protein